MKTTNEIFKEVLDELGFSGCKPSEMSNSDYWMCTEKAMERYAEQFKKEINKMKSHWIGIIKWNDGTILKTEPFYEYDEGIKVWSSNFSYENKGKFEWIDYEKVEEPKQELPQFGTKEFNDLASAYFGGKPKQYSKYLSCCRSEEECYCKEELKQETLEEVRKVERSDLYNKINSIVKQIPREDVETDAMDASSCAYDIEQLFYKWQVERSYSETEVLQLLLRLQQTESYNNLYDWFEQNKMTKLTSDDFQQKLVEKLKYGELPYQNASIFTVILDLVQGNGPEEVFRVFYEVIKWQEQFKNK